MTQRTTLSRVRSIGWVLGFHLIFSYANAETIQLGGVDFILGSSRADVRVKLEGASLINSGWEGDSVLLFDSRHMLGSLHFKQGKLVSIERQWESNDSDGAIAIAKALLSVVANASERGSARATLSVRTVRQPNLDAEVLNMMFSDGSTIQVTIRRGQIDKYDMKGVSVSEWFDYKAGIH